MFPGWDEAQPASFPNHPQRCFARLDFLWLCMPDVLGSNHDVNIDAGAPANCEEIEAELASMSGQSA